jgi:hypothetical protein
MWSDRLCRRVLLIEPTHCVAGSRTVSLLNVAIASIALSVTELRLQMRADDGPAEEHDAIGVFCDHCKAS